MRNVKGLMCIAAASNAFFTWSQECLSPGNADDEEVVDASLRHSNIRESLLGMFQKISYQTSLPRDTQNKRRLQPDATDLAHKTVEVRHILVQFSSFAYATQARKSETTFVVSSPHMPSSCIASQCLLPEELPWRHLDKHCLQQQVCLGPEFMKKCDCVADCNVIAAWSLR